MRCMNEGCVDWTRTRNNYCGRFADLADCDEKEPRNLPEADVKPPVMRRFETDVTEKVKFGNNDDEYLPIEKCICGSEFGSWMFVINVYKDDPNECPKCGRKYYFRNEIKVYLIE